jgi:hypothetical protein
MNLYEDEKVRKVMYDDDLINYDGYIKDLKLSDFQSSEYIRDLNILVSGEGNNKQDRKRNAMLIFQCVLKNEILRKGYI